MHSVFHLIRRMAEFGTRGTRVRNLVLKIGLAILVSGVIVAQHGRAQATDQKCSSDVNSPDACAPDSDAQVPTAGDNSQGTGKNCSSDPASPDACAPNSEAGETQAPSGGGSGTQGASQSCGAEGSPEACGPNGQAETPLQMRRRNPTPRVMALKERSTALTKRSAFKRVAKAAMLRAASEAARRAVRPSRLREMARAKRHPQIVRGSRRAHV